MEVAFGEYLAEAPVFVRTFSGTITYWTKGAQHFYGYTWDDAVGQSSHALLKTVFPIPLEEIDAQLLKTGAWDGLLQHTRKDGRPVWTQSHWRTKGARSDTATLTVVETNVDVTDRELLSRELNHRVKNTLAVISAIAQFSLRSCNKDELQSFSGRLAALALAQDLLVSREWEYGELGDVVRQTISTFGVAEHVDIEGEYFALNSKSVVAYTLAIHELITNAMKYGSLSLPGGRIRIRWSIGGSDNDRLSFTWEEVGGPLVRPPDQTGFGTKLIGKLLVADLGAPLELHFNTEGLVATIDGPIQKIPMGQENVE